MNMVYVFACYPLIPCIEGQCTHTSGGETSVGSSKGRSAADDLLAFQDYASYSLCVQFIDIALLYLRLKQGRCSSPSKYLPL